MLAKEKREINAGNDDRRYAFIVGLCMVYLAVLFLACANNNFMEITITNDVPKKLYKLKLRPRNIRNFNLTNLLKPKTVVKPVKLTTKNQQFMNNIPSFNQFTVYATFK